MNEWDKAAHMRASGFSWPATAKATGISEYKLKCHFDPDYKRALQDRVNAYRRREYLPGDGSGHVVYRSASNEEAVRAMALIPRDTRNLTARLCGDPLPGRSALERKRAEM